MKKYLVSVILCCSVYAQTGDPRATVNYDSVKIEIIDMLRNCGALFSMDAQIDDSLLTIAAIDTGEPTLCGDCYFDVSITIGGLKPGTYYANIYSYDVQYWNSTLAIWVRDTIFIGNVTFSIIDNSTNNYEILSSNQSECSRYKSIYNESIPIEIATINNYPNPFNNTTKIEFYLPFNEIAELSVYNLKGEKLSNVFTKYYSSGNHSVIWESTNISSGLYFLTISTKSYSKSKKILLLK